MRKIRCACFGILICLSACSPAATDTVISSEDLPPAAATSSPTPFQPDTRTFTPSPSPTDTPTLTPTPYQTPESGETLRFLASELGFGIGAPFQYPEARDPSFASTFTAEFNTAMMTTFMKKVQPEQQRFDWSLADAAMQLASGSGMEVVGGPLVYNDATAPAWLGFDRADCGGWAAEELEDILKGYVQTAVARFAGRVAIWEAVNEPITGGGNCWRKILGEEYIDRAFRYAREADPEAGLMLNEAFGYAGVDRELADRFFALVRRLKEAGVPLDAVGIQIHLRAEELPQAFADEFRSFIAEAHALDVTVMITEMDVYQGPVGFFSDPLDIQRQIYSNTARACLETPDCTHLLTWGVSDRYTWLASDAGGAMPDPQPLLFDYYFQRKPAYFAVLDALRETLLEGRP